MDLEEERDPNFEQAIQEGNLDVVNRLLGVRRCLNSWTAVHWTPLYSAVAQGNRELVKLFLDRGAEVNRSNRHGLGTPLHCACDLGRCDFVKLLLQHGAEVNKYSIYRGTKLPSSKNTALFVASARGHCEIVELLLANNAEVNLPNDKKEIPLDVACQKGHIDVVKVLLDNGADVNWSGKYDGTPLIYACERNNYDLAKLLLDRGAEIDPVSSIRPLHSPLYHASLFGYTDLFKLLLMRGADINGGNADTPLHGVCYRGDFVLAELYLGMGAEMNRLSLDGKSPLFIACAAGHKTIVESLLEKGAKIDEDIDLAWSLSWYSPMYVALREGHREMINMLENVNVEMSHPYDDPIGNTINVVRNSNCCVGMYNLNPDGLVNVTGKIHAQAILERYVTKLMVAGLAFTPKVDEQIYGKCIAEMRHINSFKVYQNVTLGIVFQKAEDMLYLRNQQLLKKLEEIVFSLQSYKEFPMYTLIMRNKLKESKRKLALLTIASNVLERKVCHPRLPLHVLENILKRLDVKDLVNITRLEPSAKTFMFQM